MRKTLSLVCAAFCLAAASGAVRAEQVDNPAYVAWSKHKPGTTVTYKSTTDIKMSGQSISTEATVTQTLKEVKPEGAVVEITGKVSTGGQEQAIPARTITVLAKIEKGKEGLPAEMKGEVSDMKIGKDTVEVNGKKYETETREYSMKMTEPIAMTSQSKSWTTTDVPGGMLKSETKTTTPYESTTTMSLVGVETK